MTKCKFCHSENVSIIKGNTDDQGKHPDITVCKDCHKYW